MSHSRQRAAFIIGFSVMVTIFSPFSVDCDPIYRNDEASLTVPLSEVLPGGQGVSYLSDMTQNFGNEMSHQIAIGGNVVSEIGDDIQNQENISSKNVDEISHIVDSNYKDDEEVDDFNGDDTE